MDESATGDVEYRRARAADEEAILRVLAFANMHHVPSPEMPSLDLERFFVAEVDGQVVGCSGYAVLENGDGKTTLMAVDPALRGKNIGKRLQELRMLEMREQGCPRVITNADRPETIRWYKRHFGYEEIGTLAKEHEFGLPDVHHWTTMAADIDHWYRNLYRK